MEQVPQDARIAFVSKLAIEPLPREPHEATIKAGYGNF
jgi:hypothetical protein